MDRVMLEQLQPTRDMRILVHAESAGIAAALDAILQVPGLSMTFTDCRDDFERLAGYDLHEMAIAEMSAPLLENLGRLAEKSFTYGRPRLFVIGLGETLPAHDLSARLVDLHLPLPFTPEGLLTTLCAAIDRCVQDYSGAGDASASRASIN